MHKMMLERQKRTSAIKEDQAALDKLDETIKSHVTPNLVSKQNKQMQIMLRAGSQA